ncbi:hypothetical protein Asi02nite_21490 [Asanoa siamensis]|uniref:Uncharacterized protein n=1 Tax=Asanoa siamensis TaxID=926357 RepID=A0ABQ4CMV9_9ACTN|nr:hypothetical protein Asi02nite_21490 [Asanoa siamensis]
MSAVRPSARLSTGRTASGVDHSVATATRTIASLPARTARCLSVRTRPPPVRTADGVPTP